MHSNSSVTASSYFLQWQAKWFLYGTALLLSLVFLAFPGVAKADAPGWFKFTVTTEFGSAPVVNAVINIACTGGGLTQLTGTTSATGTLFADPQFGSNCESGESYTGFAIGRNGFVTKVDLPGGTYSSSGLNSITVSNMRYQVKVTVTDQAGTSFTASSLDSFTFNGVNASTTSSNIALFGNFGLNASLVATENGYVTSDQTNSGGLTNITTVSSSQLAIVMASSTVASSAITSTTTVKGLEFGHIIKAAREGDSRSLPGATVSAGSAGGVACTEESSNTGTYFCVLPFAADGGTDDITIGLDGYVTDRTGDTPNRLGNEAVQQITTVSSIAFGNKVTLLAGSTPVASATVTAGDSFGTTCTEQSGGTGVYFCAVPLANTGRTAQFAKSGYVTRTADFDSDRSVSSTAQVTMTYNQFQANTPGTSITVSKPVINSITLGNGSGTAAARDITITVVGSDILRYKIATTQTGLTAADYSPYSGTSIPYTLSSGDGVKTLWFRFMSNSGGESSDSSKQITLNTSGTTATYVTSTQIDVSWIGGSSTDMGFKVQRSANDGTYSTVTTTGPGVTSYSDRGIAADSKYIYRTIATTAAGDAVAVTSTAVFTISDAPTIGLPTINSTNSITWAWMDNSNYEDSFRLDFATGSGMDVDEITSNTASYITTGLSPNTRYAVRMNAFRSDRGESTASATSSAVYTLAAAPTTTLATGASTSTVIITWTANGNPTSTQYYVENITANTNSGWVTATTAKFTGLVTGTKYIFRVKARNGDSTETSFTPSFTYKKLDLDKLGSFYINEGAKSTDKPNVTLGFNRAQVTHLAVADNPGMNGAAVVPYVSSMEWTLPDGDGIKTLYAQFYDFGLGTTSTVVAASIILDSTPLVAPKITNIPPYEDVIDWLKAGAKLKGIADPGVKIILILERTDLTDIIRKNVLELRALRRKERGLKEEPEAKKVSLFEGNSFKTAEEFFAEVRIAAISKTTYQTTSDAKGNWVFDFTPDTFNTGGEYSMVISTEDADGNTSDVSKTSFALLEDDVKYAETAPPQKLTEEKKEVEEPPVVKKPEPTVVEPVLIVEEAPKEIVVPIGETTDLATEAEPQTVGAALVQAVAETATAVVKQTTQEITKGVVQAYHVAKAVADNPVVEQVNETVAAPTVAAAAVVNVVSSATTLPSMLLYLRFLFLQPAMLFGRKKKRAWGVVYNGFTKMPVDLALVRLIVKEKGQVLQSRVTDVAGRYYFLAKQGEYVLEMSKPGFGLVSKHLAKVEEDGEFKPLYHGDPINVETDATPVNPCIPLDPDVKKEDAQTVLKKNVWKHVQQGVAGAGFSFSVVSFAVSPSWWVGALLGVHATSFLFFRRLSRTERKANQFGTIRDKLTGRPLTHAVVRIFDTEYNKLLDTRVTDGNGRYIFLVGRNTYYLLVEAPGYAQYISPSIEMKEMGAITTEVALMPGFKTAEAPSPELAAALAAGTQKEKEAEVRDPSKTRISSDGIPQPSIGFLKSMGVAAETLAKGALGAETPLVAASGE